MISAYVKAVTDSAAAYVERGCRETSSNRGPCIDEIKRIYGDAVPLNEPWCAQAVYAWHLLACMRIKARPKLPKTKGAKDMLTRATAVFNVDRKPQLGDVGYRKSKYGTGHMFQVAGISHDGIVTIEGNVSNRVGVRTVDWATINNPSNGFQFIHVAEAYDGYRLVLSRLEWY